MKNIREVLRLRSQGFPGRRVAHCLGAGVSTVQDYFKRADLAGVDGAQAQGLSERELERLLFPRDGEEKPSRFPVPDWKEVHWELRKKGVTLSLLWEEYQVDCGRQGYSYSRFCELYRAWEGRVEPAMHQRQAAGERLEVDYAGMTVPIHCPETGEVSQAQVFVAAMGASGYIYAEATESQKVEDWTGSHVRALSFYGGVPEMIVLDNLKSGVAKASLTDPKLNPTFASLILHYCTAASPTRPKKPQDKAKVENAVLQVERRVLAPLRRQRFFSLAEVNQALRPLLDRLNRRHSRHLGASRRDLFKRLDLPALRPLPPHPWEFAKWKSCKVDRYYHVSAGGGRYSVPSGLVGRQVWVVLGARTVEVLDGDRRVAAHVRLADGGKSTLPGHMPPNHAQRAAWTADRVRREAKAAGEGAASFVSALLGEGTGTEHALRSCRGMLRLVGKYGRERVDAACARAVAIGGLRSSSVESILRNGLDRLGSPAAAEGPRIEHGNIRGAAYFS